MYGMILIVLFMVVFCVYKFYQVKDSAEISYLHSKAELLKENNLKEISRYGDMLKNIDTQYREVLRALKSGLRDRKTVKSLSLQIKKFEEKVKYHNELRVDIFHSIRLKTPSGDAQTEELVKFIDKYSTQNVTDIMENIEDNYLSIYPASLKQELKQQSRKGTDKELIGEHLSDKTVLNLTSELSLGEFIQIPYGILDIQCDRKESVGCFSNGNIKKTVASFKMMNKEVTRQQWGYCVSDGFCEELKDVNTSENSRKWDFPVVNITFSQANIFSRWMAEVTNQPFDLPTAYQWQHAANHLSPGFYKWTYDVFPHYKTGFDYYDNNSHEDKVIPTGYLLPNNAGFYDINSNVSEMTKTCFSYINAKDIECKSITVKGGNVRMWKSPETITQSLEFEYPINDKSPVVGVRLVLNNK